MSALTPPIPWMNAVHIICDANGKVVIASSHGRTDKEDDAIAEMIVRAVNCHAELVEALKSVNQAAECISEAMVSAEICRLLPKIKAGIIHTTETPDQATPGRD